MQLLKLVESEVQVGIPLPWNVRNQDSTLLLAKGYVVRDEAQMEMLLDRGIFVDLEEVRALEALKPAAPQVPESIFARWTGAVDTLEALLTSPEDVPDLGPRIEALAQTVMDLTSQDPDIGLFMAMRQDQARHLRYGFSHPVYTALLCVLMARRMGWAERRVQSLTQAALTMNASIASLQVQMAFQDYPVLDRQRAQIRKHPADSAALLERAGVADCAWLAAVREHHEQADGKGYPTGAAVVDEAAQVLRMADQFIARISPRTLRPAMSIQEATRQTFRDNQGGPMARVLIRELGLFPPGDFVQLANGEQAIVVRRGAEARTPLVAAVTDSQGRSVTTTVQRDTAQPEFAITGPAPDRSLLVRVPPERLYGFGVAH